MPAKTSAKAKKEPVPNYRVRGSGGGYGFLLFLALIVVAIVAVAMHRYHKSPRQVLEWATQWRHEQLHSSTATVLAPPPPARPATPSPTPPTAEPAPSPSTPPTPEPDPLTWIVAHEEHRPPLMTLKVATTFPLLANGKTVGYGSMPAGSQVQIVEIHPPQVTLASRLYGGGRATVPIESTDLVELATAELHRAEVAALSPTLPSAQPGTAASSHPKSPSNPQAQSNPGEDISDDDASALGAIYRPPATTFRLFAETAKSVKLVLYNDATGDAGRTVLALDQEQDGMWELKVKQNLLGKFYAFLLEGSDLDPAREVLDPYAVNAVGNGSRGRITGIPAASSAGPPVESSTDMVIYEMHVRDFTFAADSGVQNRGRYLGWTEADTHLNGSEPIKTALDHLSELGVTHVEIMPVQDFDSDDTSGGYNWGYMTDAYFSPEGMYASNPADESRVLEFKALVDALHARGIGVIMDVVYNHTANHAPFQFIDPQYYYRHMSDGSLSNGAGCGNEFRSEAPMGRKMILDSLKFWVKEYGIDGFRFDLMALIDQETMRQAERELRGINPNLVLFGEPWEPGASPLRDRTDKSALTALPQIGAFNDDYRNALKGPPDGSEPGWIQNGSNRDALKTAMQVSRWLDSPRQSINYLTCHDNLVLWDKLKLSMPDAGDPLLEDTMKLGYLVLFTSQGVPFLQGGEEFARTKGGNDNSYDAPDAVNEINWDLKRSHLGLFKYTRDLIALRRAHPLFRLRTRDQVSERLAFENTPDDKTLMYTLDGSGLRDEPWRRACVVLNSDDSAEAEIELPAGHWSVALDQGGAATEEPELSGKIRVHPKSGLVLDQMK